MNQDTPEPPSRSGCAEEFARAFPDDNSCSRFLWTIRFGPAEDDRTVCPSCRQKRRFRPFQTDGTECLWTCTGCGQSVSPTAGTIFADSLVPLRAWFYLVYRLIAREPDNCPAVEREFGMTRASAERMRSLVVRALGTDRPSGDLASLLSHLCDAGEPHRPARSGGEIEGRSMAGRIPAFPTRFIGRRRESAELLALIATSRLVTLMGPGGCGKSRLAARVGALLLDDHPDGVWWVDLQQVPREQPVASAVCAALGLREQVGSRQADLLWHHLSGRKGLLVLDNCEHVLESCAELVGDLLAVPGELRFVATSREAIGVAGEMVWPVPPMASSPSPGDSSDAVHLFADRAHAVRPGFRLDEATTAAVSRVCARLDGLPLAIELAAAQSLALSPAELEAALDDGVRLLASGTRGGPVRHRTLEASFEWSFSLLEDDERILLRRLSIFQGGFSLRDAQAVCGAEPLDENTVVTVLAALVRKSLVTREDAGGRSWFHLLETTQHYAGEKLADAEKVSVRDRHLAALLDLVEREPVSRGRWLDEIERHRGNLRAGLDWAIQRGDRETPLRLAAGLGLFFGVRGYFDEGRQFLADCLREGAPAGSAGRARALAASANLAFTCGDLALASTHAEEAVAMARLAGDGATVGRGLALLGAQAMNQAPGEARRHLDEAVSLSYAAGDKWTQAQALGFTVISWAAQSNLAMARKSHATAAVAVESLGSYRFLAWHHLTGACLDLRAGDLGSAAEALARAQGFVAEIGDAPCQAMIIACRAELACERGRAGHALQDTVEADCELALSARSPFIAMFLDAAAGKCLLDMGRLEEAEQRLSMAMNRAAIFRPAIEATAAIRLADIALAQDRPDVARDRLQQAARGGRALDDQYLLAAVDVRSGQLAALRGDLADARKLVCKALAVQRDQGYWLEAVRTLEVLAEVQSADDGTRLQAARLTGAATAARRRLGARRSRLDGLMHRAGRAALARSVPPATLRDALRNGAESSTTDAIAYALRGRGERDRVPSEWNGLTPTEMSIARLVADGHTNPEIGRRLFVSRSTVKAHLARIFAKTGVANRAELAAVISRLGDPA